MPELEAARQSYQAQGLVVLAVNIQQDAGPDAARQFLWDLGVNVTAVRDEAGTVQTRYKVVSLPTSYFVDWSGVIRAKQIGGMNRTFLEKKLATVLST